MGNLSLGFALKGRLILQQKHSFLPYKADKIDYSLVRYRTQPYAYSNYDPDPFPHGADFIASAPLSTRFPLLMVIGCCWRFFGVVEPFLLAIGYAAGFIFAAMGAGISLF
jgi:hypothetical protein